MRNKRKFLAGVMKDICYGCGKKFEYGTLEDINEIDFDIYCPECYSLYQHKKAKKLWKEMLDISIDDDEAIDEDWKDENGNIIFPKGTDRYTIWHWFEDEFNLSVAEDLMYPK